MSKNLTFKKFAKINRKRSEHFTGFNHHLNAWSMSDWFTALMGEFGEAANVAKKLNRIRDGIFNKEKADKLNAQLKSELGDAFVYLDLLCQSCGFTVEECATEAFNNKSDDMGCNFKV